MRESTTAFALGITATETKKYFKIWDPVTHKSFYQGMYYDEDNMKLYLPGGMDLWYVRKHLDEKYYDRIDPVPYKTIKSIGMKYKPRDNEQIEVLKFTTGMNEYEDNKNAPQLSVNIGTGKGKTYCAIATIAYYKIKAIIITGSNSLLSQWRGNILEYTNLSDNDIYFQAHEVLPGYWRDVLLYPHFQHGGQ